MIRNHTQVSRNEKVWAVVDEEIKQIIFRGIKPYQGFYYLPGRSTKVMFQDGELDSSTDSSASAFADTREELLTHLISLEKEKIKEAEKEIERLEGMREVPDPVTYVGKA